MQILLTIVAIAVILILPWSVGRFLFGGIEDIVADWVVGMLVLISVYIAYLAASIVWGM